MIQIHSTIFLWLKKYGVMKKLFFILIIIYGRDTLAQSFAINTDGSNADASAIFDVKSTSKGMLVPRMSKAQKNAITIPAAGLLIYQDAPDSTGFYYFSGSSWLWLATASNTKGWATTGNAGTDTALNFLGTTDIMPLRFKQNNGWIGQFDRTNGNYFIGSGTGQKNTTGGLNAAMGDSALANNTTAFGGVAIGANALMKNTSGLANNAVGSSALRNNITGSFNLAMGSNALGKHKSGDDNVAIGSSALLNDTTGSFNVAIGASAMLTSVNSSYSVAIGPSALMFSKNGTYKIGIGSGALSTDTTTSPNIAIGANTLLVNVSGKSNLAIGTEALSSNKVSNNLAIGMGALKFNTFAGNNTAIGDSALYTQSFNNSNAVYLTNNTAIGSKALFLNQPSNPTNGGNNVAIGNLAMAENTNGEQNVAIGSKAMEKAKGFFNRFNVAIGVEALRHDSASFGGNTAIGYKSGVNNSGGFENLYTGYLSARSMTSGNYNVAMGAESFQGHDKGDSNVVIGAKAMGSTSFPLKNGNYNTAIGYESMFSNDTSFNTAVGYMTLRNNITGSRNTAIGIESLFSNTISGNTAIGFRAARSNTNGTDILAIGDSALFSNTLGTENVAIGNRSLISNTTGDINIAIGKNALAANQLGSQNIAIGQEAMMNMNLAGFSINTANVAIGFQSLQNVDPAAVVLSGNQNTAVGTRSGNAITTGYYNTTLGALSGGASLSNGFQNTLIGHSSTASGNDNTHVGNSTSSSGDQNSLFGSNSDVNGFSTNATAIGYRAQVAASNSLVLGSINGVNGATSNVNVGIGTTTPDARFHVVKDSSVSSSIINPSSIALFENDNTGYIQLVNPSTAQAGLISGTSVTSIRSGIFFNADSSVNFRSGGNSNRITLDNTGFVGVRTVTPLSYLDVSGSTANAISVSASSQTLDEFDHTHIILNTAGAITITLPAANTCARREYVIVNQDNNAKTISSYFDFTGIANTSIPLNGSITLQSNGSSWYRIR